MTTWPATVEAWRSLLEDNAGDLDVEFLLAWINRESAGSACSYTKYHECGIFQLDPSNMATVGTSEAELRTACNTGQWPVRELTDDEKLTQVTTGIAFVNHCRDVAREKLAANGLAWDEDSVDFWRLVKMVHAAPARLSHLSADTPDWDSFKAACLAAGDTPAAWLANPEAVGGAYGGTPGSGGFADLVLMFALAIGALLLTRFL